MIRLSSYIQDKSLLCTISTQTLREDAQLVEEKGVAEQPTRAHRICKQILIISDEKSEV